MNNHAQLQHQSAELVRQKVGGVTKWTRKAINEEGRAKAAAKRSSYREILGQTLRERRKQNKGTLRDVSAAGLISIGYLSEVERGQKNIDGEVLEYLCTEGLNIPLHEILIEVALKLREEREGVVSDEQLNQLIFEETASARS